MLYTLTTLSLNFDAAQFKRPSRKRVVASTPSSMILRLTMDFFQHRYYRLNKTLMSLCGQWPYQSSRDRRGRLVAIIFITISQIIPQTLAVVKYCDDSGIVLDSALPFLIEIIMVTKLIGFIWNAQRLSLLRTAVIYTGAFLCMTQPIIPTIIDVLLMNGTEPGQFPYPLDYYYFDAQNYYCYIIVYCYVCVYIGVTIIIAGDIILITQVQHVCGDFAALGHKLERIGNGDNSVAKGERPYYTLNEKTHLASCIDRHNDAIEYADLVEATYTWYSCFLLGFGMILLMAAGLQILITKDDPEVTLKCTVIIFMIFMHYYIECYISQTLIDHSIGIPVYIQKSQWYRLSAEAQKCLQLITVRCREPCRLTAGKLLVLSVRTYGLTLRTALSYFTVIRSMQGV